MGPIIHLYTILGEPPCWGPRAELTVGHLEVTLFGCVWGSGFQDAPLLLRSQGIAVLVTSGYLSGDRRSLS